MCRDHALVKRLAPPKCSIWLLTPARVVEREVAAETGPRLGDGRVRVQVDLFVLDGAPEPLDENVIAPAALPVHVDADAVRGELVREVDG